MDAERGPAARDRVAAFPLVILAGGKSSRLGAPKGLVRIGDTPWIEVQLARFAEAAGPRGRAVVVTGFDTAAYASALPWFSDARRGADGGAPVVVAGVTVTTSENPSPDRGPFSSLQCALAHVRVQRSETAAPGAWVLPVDVPLASPASLDALAAALTGDVDAALPVFDGSGGHPVLLSAALVARLLEVPPDADDARLDRQLHAQPRHAVARVAVDDRNVRRNLNTAADWDAAMVDRALPGFRRP